MVKGLLIRQVFMVVDLSLALLVAFVIYLVSAKLLDTSAIDTAPPDLVADTSSLPERPHVASRESYDSIITSGLFGPAGQIGKPNADPGLITETAAPPTLKLYGTASSTPTDPLGTAVIENTTAKTLVKVATYYLGQAVTDELTLVEVQPRKVILLNKAKNQRQVLAMADTFMASPTPLGKPGMADLARAKSDANHPVIQRQDVAKELTNGQDLLAQLNPHFPTDDQGNVMGLAADNISSVPLLAQAGLKDGDLVQSVNGMNIKSQEDLLEVLNKFSSSKTVRLGIVRGGAPQMLTIGLE